MNLRARLKPWVEVKTLIRPNYLEKISDVQGNSSLLCVHGLNQNPSCLRPLLRDIEPFGYEAYLLHLPGHRDLYSSYEPLLPHFFSTALLDASAHLLERYGKPPLFVGYSFGGLLGVLNADQILFSKMILLAPALRLRFYAHLLRPTLPFVKKIKSVSLHDSRLEQKYRFYQNGVPSEIYKSFFCFYSQLHKKDKSYLRKTKGLVFSHPNDELVSFSSLNSWVRNYTDWSRLTLNNSQAEFCAYNHLCFDKQTLGERSYNKLISDIYEFICD